VVFEAGLLDDVSIPTTLLNLQSRILARLGETIVKLKSLALNRRTFLNLNVQAIIPQVEDHYSVYLPLPDELRPVLREKSAGEKQNRK